MCRGVRSHWAEDQGATMAAPPLDDLRKPFPTSALLLWINGCGCG